MDKRSPEFNQKSEDIYDSLTEEQKDRIKDCKDADEVIQLFGIEKIELPDGFLENVNGGIIFAGNALYDKKTTDVKMSKALKTNDTIVQSKLLKEDMNPSINTNNPLGGKPGDSTGSGSKIDWV